MGKGFWADLFGPPSDEQVKGDIERGEAQPRTSGESLAATDYYKEAYETGQDPLDKDTSSSESGGKKQRRWGWQEDSKPITPLILIKSMLGKKFEKELKMIEDALDEEQSKDNFKGYLRPFVESIVEKYTKHDSAKGIPKKELIDAGWAHFDFALRKYKERAELMMERRNDVFYFSTYFAWFVRQGIVEYLKSRESDAH